MNFTKSPGQLCLGIYLLLVGLSFFVPALAGMGMITSLLAVVAGVLILIGK